MTARRRTAGQSGIAAEHALLGLLAMGSEEQPGYGYDLARHFGEGQPLAEVLRLEPGMLYHHLKKLARAGWIVTDDEALPGRPTRRLSSLTQAGRSELERWLREPVAHTREIRLDFLVKLYFVGRLAPSQSQPLLDGQRHVLERLINSLRGQRNRLSAGEGGDATYARLVLELRLAQTEAALLWLDRVRQALPGEVATQNIDPARRLSAVDRVDGVGEG